MVLLIVWYFGIAGLVSGSYVLHPSTAHFALWGNISNFEDFFLPPMNYSDTLSSDLKLTHQELKESLDDSYQIHKTFEEMTNLDNEELNDTGRFTAENDFKMVTKDFQGNFANVFRRATKKQDKTENATVLDIYINVGLQFLVHTRHLVAEAVAQKNKINTDKRYKLGYMFSRLRKLKNEMHNFIFDDEHFKFATEDKYTDTDLLHDTLQTYETVVQYEVDIKDVIRSINLVYLQKADVDFV